MERLINRNLEMDEIFPPLPRSETATHQPAAGASLITRTANDYFKAGLAVKPGSAFHE